MINVDLSPLIGKLDSYTLSNLESAAGFCLSRTHFNVELEHWFLKLFENPDSNLSLILSAYKVNPAKLVQELALSLEQLRTGNSRRPDLAPALSDLLHYAWLLASVEVNHQKIGSPHLLGALLLSPDLRRPFLDSCPSLEAIPGEAIRDFLHGLTPDEAPAPSPGEGATAQPVPSEALERFTVDLTARAREGLIDPVLGRDDEIRQCIDIFSRRRQNNPILTGEAGVGKTAVVEGLALRIAAGDVPDSLKNVCLRVLDLGLLQAGASFKGEFEKRLRQVIDEVKASPVPIIIFIDEAHTLIGAGGAEGQGDAANLLKPALARGELRTVAATTWAEYKRYFEKDPALTRRFQVVKVEEPSLDRAIAMMRGVAQSLEAHHKVRILDEAITASVKLSARYIPGRQLPDKSVSLLDTACARVSLSQTGTPAPIEDHRRALDQIDRTLAMLEREQACGGDCLSSISELREQREQIQQRLEQLSAQWQEETGLVKEIRELKERLAQAHEASSQAPDQPVNDNSPEPTDEPGLQETSTIDPQEARQRLMELQERLEAVQGDSPLIHVQVDAQAIAEVVADWTGIPVGKMLGDEVHAILNLGEQLNQRVIGQPQAIAAIARNIRSSRAGLADPNKPIGVFMMTGPSGVGKTETALALADILFGGDQNLTVINMSEFKEEHKVSMLLGAPPGYVGYGEGGVLTEAARRKPYSVILLDEMEKAHPGVQDVFYNLFDKGTIKDGEGRDIDFRNTLIIMTSNVGDQHISHLCQQAAEKPAPEQVLETIRPELLRHFKAAFLGRVSVIPYYPLDSEHLLKIAEMRMQALQQRLQERYGAPCHIEPAVLEQIVSRCQDTDTGARTIESILNQTLLPELATECLTRLASGSPITQVEIGLDEFGNFRYQLQ